MSTDAVTSLRQRMIEDMNARKLGAHSQRSHISSERASAKGTPDKMKRTVAERHSTAALRMFTLPRSAKADIAGQRPPPDSCTAANDVLRRTPGADATGSRHWWTISRVRSRSAATPL